MKLHRKGEVQWDREYEDFSQKELRWMYTYKQWHLIHFEDEYYSERYPHPTLKRKNYWYYIQTAICGKEDNVTQEGIRLWIGRGFPEGTICPICKAFYEGLHYKKPRKKVGAKWKKKSELAAGEKPWFLY